MSVYRVDYLNGKFYIGKVSHHNLKKRMREHRCVKGCGLAVWFPDEDITTATIREIGRPTENETIAECEDRLIREVLGDANCLNKNRGHRTLDEVKQQKKESYVKYMAEHPEKKAEYDGYIGRGILKSDGRVINHTTNKTGKKSLINKPSITTQTNWRYSPERKRSEMR